jgi:hypothetical protein
MSAAVSPSTTVYIHFFQYPSKGQLKYVKLNASSMSLCFLGEAGKTMSIQDSPDLKNWTTIAEIAGVGGKASFVGPFAFEEPQKFFRFLKH